MPDINSEDMLKILRWCEFHSDKPLLQIPISDSNVEAWDRDFLDMTPANLISILKAADYLGVEELVQLCCWQLANLLRNKTPKQMIQILQPKDVSFRNGV